MSEPSSRSTVKRRLLWTGFPLAVCVLAGWTVGTWLAAPSSRTLIVPSSMLQTKEPRPLIPTNDSAVSVLGTWEDRYEGKRTMTLKEDGTGTMVVELSGLRPRWFPTTCGST